MPTEHEEVEVELTRSPAAAVLPAEGALDPLERRSRARAPVAGSGPAGTSSATTALWKSGSSVTPTGRVT